MAYAYNAIPRTGIKVYAVPTLSTHIHAKKMWIADPAQVYAYIAFK
jgi:hypothetical protein